MKILLLCWRDSTHPLGGGSERYLERVGEYLAAQGHEVVFFSAAHTESPRRQTRRGVRFLRAGGKYSVYPAAWWRLLAARLGLGPFRGVDVVVDTHNGIPFFARIPASQPTVVLTHHRHKEQWPVAGPVIGRLGWWLESQVAPRVYRDSRWVTVSEASKADLVELGLAPGQIEIVANGIDPVPPAPVLPPSDKKHLITLSRLVPNKQIEHALDVLARIEDPSVVLDIVGSGWWEERLREHARTLGVTDRVRFYGHVTEDYKHALLARASLHLMPSRKEGWGLAVIEAAQHGVPTVGYREAGGLQDSVQDGVTGVLVDAPAHLLHTTQYLLDNPAARHRLGANARDWAGGFSWADTGARWEEILTAAVGPTTS